jgi:3-oxoacyl-[acyl-carrier protein] reductase
MNPIRVAWITGAGSGIGAAIAAALATQGYHVVVSDIDLTKATHTTESLIKEGYSANALAIDVSQPRSIASGFAAIEQRYARCDVLVNNAGIATPTSLHSCKIDEWAMTMLINVTAAMLCSQHAFRLMKQKR